LTSEQQLFLVKYSTEKLRNSET